MIEYTLVCDECSAIIDAASSVRKVRKEAREYGLYKRKDGRDLCWRCLESRPVYATDVPDGEPSEIYDDAFDEAMRLQRELE